MTRARPGTAALVAAIGGLALLGSLFLDWYAYASGASLNAWEAFSAADVVSAALAVLVVLLAAAGPIRTEVSFVRYGSALIMAVAGIAALVLVAGRLVLPPGPPEVLGVIGVSVDASREVGVFVGLVAAVAMAVGGVIAASGIVLERVSTALDRVERGI